ncbi:hypothetical protein [Bifidobacterium catulorum]|uniref:Uncharacterized protein n=1 Tax=Bifidobacterium catulorum TaxID=1630173 RepID=A0A2U2MQD0_9BIFI|nr:hypothetical protein [Bifidobacterium catulorum]PWG59075.1 hypothetical protein DF200_09545 [Bifidobacterium catulorum]
MRRLRNRIIRRGVIAALMLIVAVPSLSSMIAKIILGAMPSVFEIAGLFVTVAVMGLCAASIMRNVRRMRTGPRTARGIVWLYRIEHSTDSDGGDTTRETYQFRMDDGVTLSFLSSDLPAGAGRDVRTRTPGTHIILRWFEGTDIIETIMFDPAYPPTRPEDAFVERVDKDRYDYTVTHRLPTDWEREERAAAVRGTKTNATPTPTTAKRTMADRAEPAVRFHIDAAADRPDADDADAGSPTAGSASGPAVRSEVSRQVEFTAAQEDAKARYRVFDRPTKTVVTLLIVIAIVKTYTAPPFGREHMLLAIWPFLALLALAAWLLGHAVAQRVMMGRSVAFRRVTADTRSALLRGNLMRHLVPMVLCLAIGLTGTLWTLGTIRRGPVTEPVTLSAIDHRTGSDDGSDSREYTDFTFVDDSGNVIRIRVNKDDERHILDETGDRTGRRLILTYWEAGGGRSVFDSARPDPSAE